MRKSGRKYRADRGASADLSQQADQRVEAASWRGWPKRPHAPLRDLKELLAADAGGEAKLTFAGKESIKHAAALLIEAEVSRLQLSAAKRSISSSSRG